MDRIDVWGTRVTSAEVMLSRNKEALSAYYNSRLPLDCWYELANWPAMDVLLNSPAPVTAPFIGESPVVRDDITVTATQPERARGANLTLLHLGGPLCRGCKSGYISFGISASVSSRHVSFGVFQTNTVSEKVPEVQYYFAILQTGATLTAIDPVDGFIQVFRGRASRYTETNLNLIKIEAGMNATKDGATGAAVPGGSLLWGLGRGYQPPSNGEFIQSELTIRRPERIK